MTPKKRRPVSKPSPRRRSVSKKPGKPSVKAAPRPSVAIQAFHSGRASAYARAAGMAEGYIHGLGPAGKYFAMLTKALRKLEAESCDALKLAHGGK